MNGKNPPKSFKSRSYVFARQPRWEGGTKDPKAIASMRGGAWSDFGGNDAVMYPAYFDVMTKIFQPFKYFADVKPMFVDWANDRIMDLVMDYFNAGLIEPWTLLETALKFSKWHLPDYAPLLFSRISITRENWPMYLMNRNTAVMHSMLHDVISGVLDKCAEPGKIQIRTEQLFYRHWLENDNLPGLESGFFGVGHKSSDFISLAIRGIRRDEYAQNLKRETAEAAAALARDIFAEKEDIEMGGVSDDVLGAIDLSALPPVDTQAIQVYDGPENVEDSQPRRKRKLGDAVGRELVSPDMFAVPDGYYPPE